MGSPRCDVSDNQHPRTLLYHRSYQAYYCLPLSSAYYLNFEESLAEAPCLCCAGFRGLLEETMGYPEFKYVVQQKKTQRVLCRMPWLSSLWDDRDPGFFVCLFAVGDFGVDTSTARDLTHVALNLLFAFILFLLYPHNLAPSAMCCLV